MQEKTTTNKLEYIVEWFITIVFTLALLVGVFLFAMDIANAEEMNNQSISYCEEYLDEHCSNWRTNTSFMNGWNSIISECPYFSMYSCKINSQNIYFLELYGAENLGLMHYGSSNTYTTPEDIDYSRGFIVTRYNTNNIGDGVKVASIALNDNSKQIVSFYYVTSVSGVNYNSYYGTYYYNCTSQPIYYINGSYNGASNGYTYISSYGSPRINIAYRSFMTYDDNFVPISESTKGFNVFIYNDLGIDYVRFVPNGLVTVGSHYSNDPTISFDLVLNDNVTIPVTYDESAGYYFESIEYGKAYYEIPVIELLPSSIADFDNIYITNVVYTNEWSNPSESGIDKFYYVDKCWLKRTYNNEEIGQVSVPYESTDTGYNQQEITDIYNMITNASSIEGTFDVEKNLSGGSSSPISFSSFQDAVVNTIECYHVTGTTTSDWSHIEIDYPPISVDSGNNMYWLNYNGNTTGSFNSRYSYYCSPYSYVRENNYSGYYDIVYFIVHEMVYDETGNIARYSDLSTSYTKYYYFISYRYYNKLILYREMDILEYLKLGNEGQEKIYDYLFYKINNIDDNIYYFFKDKLNIDNDIVDKIKEIDNSITLSTDSIMDLLNRILNALLDINIEPVEPLDITPITTRLDLILEKQTNSNLNNDWYKNFRQWLYEETDNSLVDTPHEWFIDKLNSIKSLYNIFGGHDTTFYYTPMMNVIDGYIHGQDLFNDETTYSTFYYKGTWSDGFNTSTFDSYHISNNNEVQ